MAPNIRREPSLADILDTGDTTIEFFRRKGMIQPYYSPLAEKFDRRFRQSKISGWPIGPP